LSAFLLSAVMGLAFALALTTQAAAVVTDGTLNGSYVADGACMAGPHANATEAAATFTYGATISSAGESFQVSRWNESADAWGYFAMETAGPGGGERFDG